MEIQVLPYPELTSIPEAVLGLEDSDAQQREVEPAIGAALRAAPPDGRHELELEGRIGETAPPAHEEAKPKRSSKPKAKPRAKAKAKEAPREDASNSSQASDRAPEAQDY